MINNILNNDKEHQLIFSEFFPEYFHSPNKNHIDYKRLFRLVCYKHRILNHFLEQITEVDYPKDFIARLKNERIHHQKKVLQRLSLQTEIYHLLEAYDLIFLKGLTLSQRLYNNFSYRLGGDIDFLIKPKDEKEIIEILQKHGYHKYNNTEHHYTLRKEGISIEIHRKLSDVHKTKHLENEIWQHKEYIEINNIPFPVLSSNHEYPYLLYNASVHFWTPMMLLLDYIRYRSKFEVSLTNTHLQNLEQTILNLIEKQQATSYQQKIILRILLEPLNKKPLFLIKKAIYFAQISEHPYGLSILKSFIRMIKKINFGSKKK